MDILNPSTLRDSANHALARGREPKKLVYAYAGIGLIISLLVTLADLWLDNQISGTGGLSNLGTRAIFSTAQQVIPFLSSIAAMCLELGYLAGMLRISRGQYADHTDLKTGFRKFWPLLRLTLLQGILYLALGILAVQLGAVIFSMTPWSDPLMEILYPIVMSGSTTIDEATVLQAYSLMGPMFAIVAVVYVIILIPFMHRMRMANYCLLDDPRGGAMAAIRASNKMMRRRFGSMLKIDLSNWLYYAATMVMMVVMYGDLILAVLGVSVPMDGLTFSLLVYGVSLALQFGIQVLLRNRAEATYVMAYEQLREKPREDGVVLGNIFDM